MCMTIKEKYIDPFTDFGFKWIFGTVENKKLLISFLNDLLDLEDKIVTIEYRNLEKLGLKIYERKAIFDVYCVDEKNNKFIVELQRTEQKHFKDRALYYTSFPIQEQAKKGNCDYELTKVYFVAILDFTFDDMRLKENKDKTDYLTKVQLIDANTKELFYDKLTYYYLEMPKFRKTESELSSHLDKWLYYLNNLTELTHIPQLLKDDEVFQSAFDIAEFLALDDTQQFAYQQDLKTKWDNYATMKFAKEKALKEGLEQGMEKKTLEIAKNLLDVLDNETISLKTGLTIETIQNLRI